jgi:drug/metabolite transporter (DMT)-like permease
VTHGVPRIESVLLALAAAVLYALTSALQQSAAARVPHERSLRPGLLLELLRRPRWLLGNLAEVAAVALHFLALRRGSLLLVQTVLVSGLLFALPTGAALVHQRLRPADWLWTVVVVLGLGVFLAVAVPTPARDEASGRGWALVLGLGCGLVAVLLLRAPRQPGPARATYLGTACGVLFGVDAALTKATGHLLDRGLAHALGAWEPYALAGLAGFGFLLAQSAFQAGPLAASLPALTIADPVVAAAIGVLAFGEHVDRTAPALVAEVAAVAAMVAGVIALARSPLVGRQPAPAAVD